MAPAEHTPLHQGRGRLARPLRPGHLGAELHPDLEVVGEAVQKGTRGEDGYSGFTARDPETGVEHPTGLEAFLRTRMVTRIVVVGLAGDVCVRATALDGARLGFDTTVLRSHTRSVEPDAEPRVFSEMEQAGVEVAAA
ncbi:MAG: isochorismatase family protein [Acidimicrobiia bacterium]|nr:isochorismatase family protein [Acidimicrobiia bacterium]